MKASAIIAISLFAVFFSYRAAALAHCDTLEGPVVTDARAALETGKVTPVLKWINKDDEPVIHAAFQKALAVRRSGPEARELADGYFFETLVRLHRAGEGEPFAGLQPAGSSINPAVAVAEKALAAGNPEALKNFLTFAVDEGLQEKFRQAAAKKNFRVDDVDAGRAYVAAYVALMHYAEGVYTAARMTPEAHRHGGAAVREGDREQ